MNEVHNAQVAQLIEEQRAFTKREMNGHILNVHHGLNQLESFLYGDGDLKKPPMSERGSGDWREVIREVSPGVRDAPMD